MEFFLELLFDIIVEGSIEVGSKKTVSMPLRVLAAVIVLAVFLGIGGICIYIGYSALLEDDKGVAILMFMVGAFLIFGVAVCIQKSFKKKKK